MFFDEQDLKYRCACLGCKCCHIKVAGIALGVYQLFAAFFPVLEIYVFGVGFFSWLSFTTFLLFIITIVFAILLLVAIKNTKPALVWPNIILYGLCVVWLFILGIVCVLHAANVSNAAAHVLPHLLGQQTVGAIRHGYTSYKHRVEYGLGLAAICFIFFPLYIWFIRLFVQLKGYLSDKEMANDGSKVPLRS